MSKLTKYLLPFGIALLILFVGIALAQTAHSVALNWTASTTPNVTYEVLRSSTNGGPYSQINVSPVTTTNYLDTNVTAGAKYFYVIRSVDSSGTESVNSNEASAVIPQGPQAPTSLTATVK